ncbi:MAG: CPBP family intramembrane metalloprotease [Planctomycetota bacterium]|nr:MAG: CPBP family intramembrane metalloprotease [Planctomycetota bacterium]
MSRSRPISTARAVLLLGRVGWRRWRNRLAARMRSRRKGTSAARADAAPTPARTGTARKRAIGIVGITVLALFMLLAGTFQASSGVRKIFATGQDLLFLRHGSYRYATRYDTLLGPESTRTPMQRKQDERALRGLLERRVAQEYATLDAAEQADFVDAIVEQLERRGEDGFALDAPAPFGARREVRWSVGAGDPDVPRRVARVALLFALCGLVALLTSLGGSVQDLGKVDWSLEWLASLPLSGRALFWGKLAEYTLVAPMCWFVALPVALATFLLRGWHAAALPLALFAAAWTAVVAAGLRVALETWLRTRFSHLKNLQAVLTIAGSLVFVALLWLSNAPDLPAWFEWLAEHVPAAATPFGHLAWLVDSPGSALVALPLLALEAAAIAWLCVEVAARATASGLVFQPGVRQGVRGAARARAIGDAAPSWMRGALRKDLLLLARDRAFLAQTLIVPLLVVAIQLVVNRHLLQLLASRSNHAAAFAFALGAYMLVFSAATVLSIEGNSLWMLMSSPQPLDRVLRRKAALWAVVGSLYTLGGCALLIWIGHWPDARGWTAFATALAGIPIYAFIAAGLGALATDPLEPDPQRRVAAPTLYLYMAIVAMYATSIYADSLHVKFVQLVLSALLAYALWQRVRDRIPYLLDPTEAPPPQLGLSDGLLAALAFLACNGLALWMLGSTGVGDGQSVLLAFVLAALVTTAASLYLLYRAGIAGLTETLGIARRIDGAWRVWTGVALGVVCGAAAALMALGYFALLQSRPEWARYVEIPKHLESLARERAVFAILAIGVAPFVEEYLFRGLVFRGMQRSIGTAWAVIGSAAVFASVHPPAGAVPVFALGVCAAFAFQRTGRLWSAIACHLAYNAIVVGMAVLSPGADVPT